MILLLPFLFLLLLLFLFWHNSFRFSSLSVSIFKSNVVYKHQKLCPQYCRLLSVAIILFNLQTFITDSATLFSSNLCIIAFIAFCGLFN